MAFQVEALADAPADAAGRPGAIRVLPPDLIGKIAAGEVVERPTSVVKELVENALDAGATAIRIEIRRGGLSLIRVTDNGSGIAPADLELAVCRHATSKLTTLDDLFRVRTLGFRGEALASIAGVSHLELLSLGAGHATGRSLRVEGGTIVGQAPAGCPRGTSVAVRQLFFNVPARHAFQRSVAGETRQVVALCQQLALTAPHVRLVLEVDGHVALQCPGNGSLRDGVAGAYGAAVAERMLALPNTEKDGIAVTGFCSAPDEHRNTRMYCTFSVNGRLVRSQMLTYAVEEAYHALLPGGRHPVAVVHLTVPPEDVDVNVHPTKTEVRLRRDRLAFGVVRDAVRQALVQFAPVPALEPQAVGVGWTGAAGAAQVQAAPGMAPPAATPVGQSTASAHPSLIETAASALALEAIGVRPNAGDPATSQTQPSRRLHALAQVSATYIVAEDATGMYLIDQHSAHERVLYEQLLAQAARAQRDSTNGSPSQLLLQPDTVELNAAQAAWLQELGSTLERFGFQVEPFGGSTWLVRAVPRALAARGKPQALAELIDALIEREYGDGPLDDQARWAVACHAAVKAGDPLTRPEMDALIEQLERCDMRRTCPHGRPTMIHLSHAQLEREFGRR